MSSFTSISQLKNSLAISALLAVVGTSFVGASSNGSVALAQPSTQTITVPQLRERAADLLMNYADRGAAEQRVNALEALIPLPGRLEPLARKALSDRSPAVRTVAAMVVAKARLRNSADAVRPLLNDSSPFTRAAAIFALASIDAPVDQSPLAAMLEDPSPQVRAHVAFILGELKNRSAAPMLVEASAAPVGRNDAVKDRLMRLQIAEALVKLGKDEAIHEIRAAMYPSRPEDLEATALAVQILGNLQDGPAKSQLRAITSPTFDNNNPMPAEIRMGAAAALAKMGERGIAPQIAEPFMTDPESTLRAQAAATLGESRESDQLGKLAQMMNDLSPSVQVAAASGVLKITERK